MPVNFATNVKSNSSVELFWSAPRYPHGIISNYHVYYKTKTGSNVHGPETTNGTQYLVENLTPYTNYSFWVRAVTSAGPGNNSVTLFNTTEEGGNSRKHLNLYLYIPSSDALLF